jgi:hypothetical protein
MLEGDDATPSSSEVASTDLLGVALRFFSAFEFLRPKPLFEALSRQSELYDPETTPSARWIVDQVQEAMKRHQQSTMPSSENEGQAIL